MSEEPRTLEELLKLETYQGMSDAEIQMVLDYFIKDARSAGAADAISSALQESATMAAQAQQAAADAAKQRMLELTNCGLQLEVVDNA